jgi:hypothetical protein
MHDIGIVIRDQDRSRHRCLASQVTGRFTDLPSLYHPAKGQNIPEMVVEIMNSVEIPAVSTRPSERSNVS